MPKAPLFLLRMHTRLYCMWLWVPSNAACPHLPAPAARRAKRLKKLTRLFTSSTAQSATICFRQRTWLLVLTILGAHMAAFAVLVTQVRGRGGWGLVGVGLLARTWWQAQGCSLRCRGWPPL